MLDIRVGNGFDVHAFAEGNEITLCGLKIPFSKKLLGHSDADVGLHAITDAIYGSRSVTVQNNSTLATVDKIIMQISAFRRTFGL